MYQPRKCIYCADEKIYNLVSEFAKQKNLEGGYTRGGHRGKTSKNLKA